MKAKDKTKPLKLTARVTREDIRRGWPMRWDSSTLCPAGRALRRVAGRSVGTGACYSYMRVAGYQNCVLSARQLKPYRAMFYAASKSAAKPFTLKLTFQPLE